MTGGTGGRRAAIALAAVCCATLASAGGAGASELRVDGSHLFFDAAPGEANHPAQLHYDDETDSWTLLELAPPTAGPGCDVDHFPEISCKGGEGPLAATVAMGDGDDYYQQASYTTWDNITNVTVEHLVSERFSQLVEGGPGNDTFWTSATGSPTTFEGGPGDDHFVFYTPKTSSPSTPPGTYRLLGGEGSDTMEVPTGATEQPPPGVGVSADGGPDTDYIHGSKGDDTLLGGPGDDHLWDLSGNDLIDGGEGNDTLYGGEGDDTQLGGPGNDYILTSFAGPKHVDAGPGDDTVISEDLGVPDQVICGEGTDRVLPDEGLDAIATDCEQVVTRERCYFGPPCSVTVSMTLAGAAGGGGARPRSARPVLLGRARFNLRNSTATGRLPLSAKGVAYVAGRGQVRVLRTTRVVKRRPRKPPRIHVARMVLNFRGA